MQKYDIGLLACQNLPMTSVYNRRAFVSLATEFELDGVGGSKLLLIAVPFLIASGIITITFSGGMPTVNVNRDRATAVGRDLSTEAYKAAERVRDYGESGYR